MATHREKQQQELYENMKKYDELVKDLNEKAEHLGNETFFTHLRLYNEQKEQLEEIKQYFEEVGMPPEQNTTEAILSLALKEFHQYLMYIKNEQQPEE
ncbi:hypothetical protein [Salibacterium aidingense]|uniref:hypothetical protein n=1 Tax=Salibacterium aidingense TaxID=384933 RepID=UPI003BD30AF9